MRTEIEIIEMSRSIPQATIDKIEPVARVIYENIFQRDERYCDWASAKYKAPETHEGFAQSICWVVANDIEELK